MAGERVHFRETQTLKQDDLGDEQAYRIQIRRRHMRFEIIKNRPC